MTDENLPFRSANRPSFQPVKYGENKTTGETHGKNEQPKTQEKQQTRTRWYKQTTVWAVISSILALILSQLPPIGTWLPKDEIKAEIGNKMGLPIIVGLPAYLVLIDLKNTGNRRVTLSNLELEITYPDNTVKHCDAQSYLKVLAGQPAPQNFPITNIMLGVNEGWAEMIMFYAMPTPSEEEELSQFQSQVTTAIISKKEIVPGEGRYDFNSTAKVDASAVADAIAFFNRKFDIRKGRYKVSLICTMNEEKVTLKEFDFTLYDHHIKILTSQIEDYQFGWGLNGPAAPHRQVWASLSKKDNVQR